jgi:hypothetical protein
MFAAAAILLQRMSNALGDANLFLALSVLYLPVDYSFFHGQLDSLILLAVVGAIELQRRHLEFSSGLVLCLALVKFPTVIPFVVVFALRRQWRSLAGIVVGSSVALAGSVAVCGVNVLRTYSTFLATIGPHFAFLGIAPLSMPNLRGFIFALSKGHDTPMWLSLLAMVLLCVCVKQTWEDDIQGMCRVAAISVVANYHVNPHDLVLLLPLFAVTLPSIRWRTPSGALFVVLATPILHGFRLILGGFWFVTPLVLVFLWLTLREDWGLVKSYSSPAVSQ